MKGMTPATARTLTWLAASLAVAGGVIMSPSGSMLLLAAASLSALFPALFAKGRTRFVAAVLLFAALGLAVSTYPAFRHDQEVYRQHTDRNTQQQPRTR